MYPRVARRQAASALAASGGCLRTPVPPARVIFGMLRARRMPILRRLIAAVMAPWLALLFAMPEAAHACAMHGGLGHAVGHVAATDQSAGTHHAMSHAMATPELSRTPAPTPASPTNATRCTCPDGCCTVVVADAEVPTSLSWVRALPAHREPAAPRALVSVALSTDVRLPFANGPPSPG